MSYLEEKITDDIIKHTLDRVHRIMSDSIDIVPAGHEPRLLLIVAMELLMGTCNSFSDNDYFPMFQKLNMAQKIMVITGMLVKTLPENERPKLSFTQHAEDVAVAMHEVKGLFNFKVDHE